MKNELITDVRKMINEEKYVVLDNFKTDFRKMRELSDKEIELARGDASETVKLLERKIKEYCQHSAAHGIPVDTLDVIGEPGLILYCGKYYELMKSYIVMNYKKEKKKQDLSVLKKENNWKEDVCELYDSIDIEDTPGIVPIKFQFIAWTKYPEPGDLLLHPFYYLGLDPTTIYDFSKIVAFDDFVKSLKENDYELKFTPNWFIRNHTETSVNSYEDYFNGIKNDLKNIDETAKARLLIRIRINDDNNK